MNIDLRDIVIEADNDYEAYIFFYDYLNEFAKSRTPKDFYSFIAAYYDIYNRHVARGNINMLPEMFKYTRYNHGVQLEKFKPIIINKATFDYWEQEGHVKAF